MSINISITSDGKTKITMGSGKVRLDSLDKFLGRNRDAVLVKLEGDRDPSMVYKPGHICSIETEDNQNYYAFVGNHMIGKLPPEAIAFAESVDSSPEFLVSMVGEVEDDSISIYIAE